MSGEEGGRALRVEEVAWLPPDPPHLYASTNLPLTGTGDHINQHTTAAAGILTRQRGPSSPKRTRTMSTLYTSITASTIIALLLLSGCGIFDGDNPTVRMGIIEIEGDEPANATGNAVNEALVTSSANSKNGDRGIRGWDLTTYSPLEAPDTVKVGQKASITVNTVAGSNCWEAYREEIDHNRSTVTITAYDRRLPWEACLTAVFELWRILPLEFDTPGEATIRLRGRKVNREGELEPGIRVREHSLVVVE